MRNQSLFADFVSSGWFSGGNAPSIPQDTEKLLDGFKTLLVSKALVANGYAMQYFSAHAHEDDCQPEDCSPTVNEATSGCWHLDCSVQRETQDFCDSWLYGTKDSWLLGLIKIKDPPDSHEPWEFANSILDAIIGKEWVHMQEFFSSPMRCNRALTHKQAFIQMSKDNVLDVSCLNQLYFRGGADISTNGELEELCPARAARLMAGVSSDEHLEASDDP